jgi:hypothetical protein
MNREEAIELLKGGEAGVAKWNAWRKEHPEVDLPDLCEADFGAAKLSNANLASANLRNANFAKAHLFDANLNGATLDGADLSEVFAANLILEGATLIQAKLTNAIIRGAESARATLVRANMDDADISNANFEGANLREVNLSGADLYGTNFSDANVGLVTFRKPFKRTLGARVATCFGSPLFTREVQDLSYIAEHKKSRPVWAWIWKVTCNYGRSVPLLSLWFIGLALIYAAIYTWGCAGALNWDTNSQESGPGFWSAFYYSVVTLTTLGFGDIVPTIWYSKLIVMTQVIVGYVLLGLLVSVLADKVARRS